MGYIWDIYIYICIYIYIYGIYIYIIYMGYIRVNVGNFNAMKNYHLGMVTSCPFINDDFSGSHRLGQVLSRGRVGGYGDPKTRGCGGSDVLEISQIWMETYGKLYLGVQARGYSWYHYC